MGFVSKADLHTTVGIPESFRNFTHGIATIVSTNTTNIAPEEIRQLLTEACASFKLYHNENKGGPGNET